MPLGKGTIRLVDYPPSSFETITVNGGVVGLTAGNIRYRYDASASSVSATVGHYVATNGSITLIDPTQKALTQLRFVKVTSAAKISVTHF